MKRIVFIFTLILLALPAKSQNVQASVFFETFDGTAYISGNDGDFSTISNSFPVRYDNSNWTYTSNAPLAAAQCIRMTTSKECHLKNKISVNKGKIKISFTAGLFNTTLNTIGLKPNPSSNITLSTGKMESYEYESSIRYAQDMNLEFHNNPNNKQSNFTYFFLDNITVYQEESTDEQQKKAQRLVLSGTFDESQAASLNANIKDNKVIVDIDAKDATFPEGTTLTPGNKNCLIYASTTSNISNTENLVINGNCSSLVLYDGDHNNNFPFFAKEDFTADKASYDRDFTDALNGNYASTVCLPFSFGTSSGAKVNHIYNLTKFDGSTLSFTEISENESNTPALIHVKDAQPFKELTNVEVKKSTCCMTNLTELQKYTTFCGVYLYHDDIISDNVTSAFGFSQGKLTKITQAGNYKPFRAFFTILTIAIKESSATLSTKFEVPTSIQSTTVNDKPEEEKNIFDLQGRSVNTLSKAKSGIYIINHKKHYIKH